MPNIGCMIVVGIPLTVKYQQCFKSIITDVVGICFTTSGIQSTTAMSAIEHCRCNCTKICRKEQLMFGFGFFNLFLLNLYAVHRVQSVVIWFLNLFLMIYLRVHNRYLNLRMHKHLLDVKHDKTSHKVVSFNTLPWRFSL